MNTGALKGSHTFSHEHPQDLERDRVYPFVVEIWAIAIVFKTGHRVRIDISTSDFPFFESNPVPSRNLVYHDAR
jgi:predicted acyl esterase